MIINELQEMRAVGASEEEIRLYRDNKIREMKAVGATDAEIQTELGGSKLNNTTQSSYWSDLEQTRPLSYSEKAEKKLLSKVNSQQNFMPEVSYTPAGPQLDPVSQLIVEDEARQSPIDNKFEFGRYFKRGLGMSNFNLMYQYFTDGSLPEGYTADTTQPSRFERVTEQVANIVADLPIYATTAYFATRAERGKTKGFAPLYAAGFVNGAIRESFMTALEQGDVDTWSEWWNIFTHEAIQAGNKEGLTLAGSIGAVKLQKIYRQKHWPTLG